VAALIAARRDEHGISAALACRALGVSRSWFYKHDDGALPPRAARHEQLKAEVKRLFAAHEGKYGSPRITADLRDEGWAVSKNTVAAVMRELGLAARRKKKRKAATRAGKGPLAGAGPGQAGLPGAGDQRQVVRRRDGGPHRRGQAPSRLGPGRGLAPGAGVRAV